MMFDSFLFTVYHKFRDMQQFVENFCQKLLDRRQQVCYIGCVTSNNFVWYVNQTRGFGA